MTVKLAPQTPEQVAKAQTTKGIEDEKSDINQSKQDLDAYLDNLLEDVFSQLPGS
ncbi:MULTISPECIES: hypothetical protein [unclassified Motilimonas]|uniref:hypothetical protein n=1 Tax=Motilimonas TaxID=1914248 RepID=UPI001E34189C|nr:MULTISPECIES: hypothetical protein [unclassified Motilimonas]MCE0558800.1 hypothetical protein [Motilimonas sp. E26]MDO6526511.1 hypothetical protein [Motilimonas sp. 1_MG-2023]